jgi:hypothetical protein
MRRILLIAALLLLPVASAMAATTISAVKDGAVFEIDGVAHQKIIISYSTDVDIRAFALQIDVDNGTNIGDNPPTDFLAGESDAITGKGYGIFPSRFRDFIDPANPDWGDGNYMPLTAWNEPGAEDTGLGWPSMVVELGTLYSGDGNKPALSGTLFKFDVNSEGLADCNLVIAVDDLRGGVVDSDAEEVAATFPTNPLYILFASPPPDIPASITYPATHDTGRYTVSWASSAGATGYIVEQDLDGGGYAQVYDGAGLSMLADATEGTNTFRVLAYNDGGQSGWRTGSGSVVTYCFGAAVTGQAEWLTVGRPISWCYPMQCHGDADGLPEGKSPNIVQVGTNDLGVLKQAWLVTPAGMYAAPDPNGGGDIDRLQEGKSPNIVRVGTNDLGVLKANWLTTPTADCLPGTVTP